MSVTDQQLYDIAGLFRPPAAGRIGVQLMVRITGRLLHLAFCLKTQANGLSRTGLDGEAVGACISLSNMSWNMPWNRLWDTSLTV
jgi:hypothetical protein